MTILEIILIAIILIMLFIGYKKGLLGTAVAFLGTVVPLFVAWIAAPRTAALLMRADALSSGIRRFIENNMLQSTTGNAGTSIKDNLLNSIIESTDAMQSEINNITGKLGEMMLTIICFFVILILCVCIVRLIKKLASDTNKLPVIGTANRIGGMLVSIGLAFSIDLLIVAVLYYWYVFSGNSAGADSISRGIITGWLLKTFII